jgi:hypothetical protein
VRNQWTRLVVVLSSLSMPLFLCIAPSKAAPVVPPPTGIQVVQHDYVMTATVVVGASQTVGVVTVQVGSADPVTIARPNVYGDYTKTLTLADLGSSVVFRAAAVSRIDGKSVASDSVASAPVTFRRAQPPTKIDVSQDDMSLSVAVSFAPGTQLSLLEMKVGGGYYSTVCDANKGDNCGDGPFVVDLKTSQLGKNVVFRISSAASRDEIPDSVQVLSDTFVFAQSPQPTNVALTQDGYIIHIDPSIGSGQTVGDVTVFTFTQPDGETLDPVDGKYSYEFSSEDLNKRVRVDVTAQTPSQVLSTVKSATIVPGIAGLPTLSEVHQSQTVASVNFTVPAGTTAVVTATVDGDIRPVTVADGIAMVALSADDVDRLVQFYAHGTRSPLPDSDEVVSVDYIVVAADVPLGIVTTLTDSSLCAQTQLSPGQTLGVVLAKVNDVLRPVSVSGSQECVAITRADAGKDVVFSVTARSLNHVESQALDSEPYTVQVADKPTVKVVQKGNLITVSIHTAPGQKVGSAVYVIGKSPAVTLKPVKGKYSLKIKPAYVGKKIVVKTTAAQMGFLPSAIGASAPLLIKK